MDIERRVKFKNASFVYLLKSWKIFRRIYNAIRLSMGKGNMRRAWQYSARGHICRSLRISRYLRDDSVKKLQIGGGYHTLNGWINGDLIAGDIYLNATKRFPFPTGSFDFVFSEQFIEHLDFENGLFCLMECHRVLKNGGKIRLSTPDMEKLCLLYKDEIPGSDLAIAMARHKKHHNRGLTTACHFLNDFFRLWGHSFLYDEETLRRQMEKAGFENVCRQKYGDSDSAPLMDKEQHIDSGDCARDVAYDVYYLILEAIKK